MSWAAPEERAASAPRARSDLRPFALRTLSPRTRVAARAALAGSGLLGRFSYLLATQIVLVVTGLGYWAITTRQIAAHEIGVAAAAVSMATLLSAIGVLGVTSIMLVALHELDERERRSVITTGVFVASIAVGILCGGSLLIARRLGPSMRVIGSSPYDSFLYLFGAMALTAGLVADNAAIGIRRAPAQFARNTVQALLRLSIVVAVATLFDVRSASLLLAAWVISIVISLTVTPPLLRLAPRIPIPLAERLATIRRLRSLALRHHVLNLAITSVSFLLPATAALLVTPRLLAYFSVAQLMASSALLPPALLAMTLFAETAGDEEGLRRGIRRTLPVGFGCCILVLAIGEPFAPQILRIFGPGYAEHSLTPLRLLLLAGLPYVLKDHYVAIRRAQHRLTEAARLIAGSTALEIGGAAVGGAVWGINGLCIGWVAVTLVEAFGFGPQVFRVALRPKGR